MTSRCLVGRRAVGAVVVPVLLLVPAERPRSSRSHDHVQIFKARKNSESFAFFKLDRFFVVSNFRKVK